MARSAQTLKKKADRLNKRRQNIHERVLPVSGYNYGLLRATCCAFERERIGSQIAAVASLDLGEFKARLARLDLSDPVVDDLRRLLPNLAVVPSHNPPPAPAAPGAI